jgi:hypothetical protein
MTQQPLIGCNLTSQNHFYLTILSLLVVVAAVELRVAVAVPADIELLLGQQVAVALLNLN